MSDGISETVARAREAEAEARAECEMQMRLRKDIEADHAEASALLDAYRAALLAEVRKRVAGMKIWQRQTCAAGCCSEDSLDRDAVLDTIDAVARPGTQGER